MESIKTALRSLASNITRSLLAMLGITIGAGAVIIILALGNGTSQQIQATLTGLGANMIFILPYYNNNSGARSASGSGNSLTLEDSYALNSETFFITRTVPEVSTSAQVIYGNSNWNTTIVGSTEDYLLVKRWDVAAGSMFTEQDVRALAKICVIGRTVAKELFGDRDPINAIIRVRTVPFRIIGVAAEKGADPWGNDSDDFILIPVTTARRLARFGTKVDNVRMITVQASDRGLLRMAEQETIALLRQRHKLPEGVENDFNILNLTELEENIIKTTNLMKIYLAAVASISLLVGGIGIMNIMLVSVSERTREIGIRMAVGARPAHVRIQFLAEAVILSLFGGAMGIVLGVGISKSLTAFWGRATIISVQSIVIAAGFSACIGIIFGLWPAWKASNLDPIDAIRAE